MFCIFVLLAVALLFYYFLLKPQLHWSRNNVKQGMPIPILGDYFKFILRQETLMDTIKRIYEKFDGNRYCGLYQTTIPTLMLRDPDLIKLITVKDFDHFEDHRSFTPDNVDPVWSNNLFNLKGDRWREMRATLSPTFTASKMRAMFTLMEKSAQQYIDFYIKQDKDVIDLELKDSFTRFASDVIGNCAFGVTVDSLKEPTNDFYMNGEEATNFNGFWRNAKFLIYMVSTKIGSFFKMTLFKQETADFFKDLIRDTVKIREEQNIIRPDMINLLMQVRKGTLRYEESAEQKDAGFATVQESHVGKSDNIRKTTMTELDMVAQVMIFFFAGFDTISTMMCFACYELAINPDIQERLRHEIDETYEENDGKLTYDVLSKMKYMDMVITECLRKNPPVAVAIDRICTKPYTILPERPGEKPVHLRRGDIVWLPMIALHHDKELYPNPDKFDPERFSEENKGNIKPYSYLPFGSGPRNCIGSRFALMEVKTLFFHMLRKFELTVIDKTTIPMKLAKGVFSPAIEGGCWIGLKRRENSASV